MRHYAAYLMPVLLSACTIGSPIDSNSPTPQETIPPGDYFPLVEGATWTYDYRWHHDPTSPGWKTQPASTESITAVEALEGKQVATMRRVSYEPHYTTSAVPEGYVERVQEFLYEVTNEGIFTRPASGSFAPILLYRYPFQVGPTVLEPASTSVYPATTKFIGEKVQTAKPNVSVQTEAGVFDSCVEVKQVQTQRDVYTGNPSSGTITTESTVSLTVWFAPNIGAVKSLREEERVASSTGRSTSAIENTLATYSIPVKP